jgi:prophage DNA circulation protein
VEAHDAKFGRRQVTHEFAQRDEPFTEDLGRRAREFTVDGYLIGEEYPAQRDRMVAVCETAGPGELVHPYLGALVVECTGPGVRESSGEGRLCRISMSFVEAGQAKYPTLVDDPVGAMSMAANAVEDVAQVGFVGRFATGGFPSFVIDAAQAQVVGLSKWLSGLTTATGHDAQTVAAFFRRARQLAHDAQALVAAPGALAEEVIRSIAQVRDAFGLRSSSVLDALRRAYPAMDGASSGTPNRRQVIANTNALAALVRHTALAEECKADVLRADEGALGAFASRSEAIAVRDRLTGAVDTELEDPATSDDEFDALNDLRTQVVQAIPSPALRLPRCASRSPPATLPSLVVSYRFYGTAARAVEIATRNGATHPGLLPGQQPLELLSNV